MSFSVTHINRASSCSPDPQNSKKKEADVVTSVKNSNPFIRTDSSADQLLAALFEKGYIDENAEPTDRLVQEVPLPRINNRAKHEIVASLLKDRKIVTADGLTITTSLFHIFGFCIATGGQIEGVGSYVSKLLFSFFEVSLCAALKVKRQLAPVNASDIDIRVFLPDAYDTGENLRLITPQFAQYLSGYFQNPSWAYDYIWKRGFSKRCYRNEGGDHFAIVNFGDQKKFSVDLMFYRSLNRDHLFSQDNLRLLFNPIIERIRDAMNRNPELSFHDFRNEYVKLIDWKNFPINFEPKDPKTVWRAIIHRSSQIIAADKPENVNFLGWPLLMHSFAKGHTSIQSSLGGVLFETCQKYLLNQNKQTPFEKFREEFERLQKNHFTNKPLHAVAVFLNILQHGKSLWEKDQKNFREMLNDLASNKHIQGKNPLIDFLQRATQADVPLEVLNDTLALLAYSLVDDDRSKEFKAILRCGETGSRVLQLQLKEKDAKAIVQIHEQLNEVLMRFCNIYGTLDKEMQTAIHLLFQHLAGGFKPTVLTKISPEVYREVYECYCKELIPLFLHPLVIESLPFVKDLDLMEAALLLPKKIKLGSCARLIEIVEEASVVSLDERQQPTKPFPWNDADLKKWKQFWLYQSNTQIFSLARRCFPHYARKCCARIAKEQIKKSIANTCQLLRECPIHNLVFLKRLIPQLLKKMEQLHEAEQAGLLRLCLTLLVDADGKHEDKQSLFTLFTSTFNHHLLKLTLEEARLFTMKIEPYTQKQTVIDIYSKLLARALQENTTKSVLDLMEDLLPLCSDEKEKNDLPIHCLKSIVEAIPLLIEEKKLLSTGIFLFSLLKRTKDSNILCQLKNYLEEWMELALSHFEEIEIQDLLAENLTGDIPRNRIATIRLLQFERLSDESASTIKDSLLIELEQLSEEQKIRFQLKVRKFIEKALARDTYKLWGDLCEHPKFVQLLDLPLKRKIASELNQGNHFNSLSDSEVLDFLHFFIDLLENCETEWALEMFTSFLCERYRPDLSTDASQVKLCQDILDKLEQLTFEKISGNAHCLCIKLAFYLSQYGLQLPEFFLRRVIISVQKTYQQNRSKEEYDHWIRSFFLSFDGTSYQFTSREHLVIQFIAGQYIKTAFDNEKWKSAKPWISRFLSCPFSEVVEKRKTQIKRFSSWVDRLVKTTEVELVAALLLKISDTVSVELEDRLGGWWQVLLSGHFDHACISVLSSRQKKHIIGALKNLFEDRLPQNITATLNWMAAHKLYTDEVLKRLFERVDDLTQADAQILVSILDDAFAESKNIEIHAHCLKHLINLLFCRYPVLLVNTLNHSRHKRALSAIFDTEDAQTISGRLQDALFASLNKKRRCSHLHKVCDDLFVLIKPHVIRDLTYAELCLKSHLPTFSYEAIAVLDKCDAGEAKPEVTALLGRAVSGYHDDGSSDAQAAQLSIQKLMLSRLGKNSELDKSQLNILLEQLPSVLLIINDREFNELVLRFILMTMDTPNIEKKSINVVIRLLELANNQDFTDEYLNCFAHLLKVVDLRKISRDQFLRLCRAFSKETHVLVEDLMMNLTEEHSHSFPKKTLHTAYSDMLNRAKKESCCEWILLLLDSRLTFSLEEKVNCNEIIALLETAVSFGPKKLCNHKAIGDFVLSRLNDVFGFSKSAQACIYQQYFAFALNLILLYPKENLSIYFLQKFFHIVWACHPKQKTPKEYESVNITSDFILEIKNVDVILSDLFPDDLLLHTSNRSSDEFMEQTYAIYDALLRMLSRCLSRDIRWHFFVYKSMHRILMMMIKNYSPENKFHPCLFAAVKPFFSVKHAFAQLYIYQQHKKHCCEITDSLNSHKLLGPKKDIELLYLYTINFDSSKAYRYYDKPGFLKILETLSLTYIDSEGGLAVYHGLRILSHHVQHLFRQRGLDEWSKLFDHCLMEVHKQPVWFSDEKMKPRSTIETLLGLLFPGGNLMQIDGVGEKTIKEKSVSMCLQIDVALRNDAIIHTVMNTVDQTITEKLNFIFRLVRLVIKHNIFAEDELLHLNRTCIAFLNRAFQQDIRHTVILDRYLLAFSEFNQNKGLLTNEAHQQLRHELACDISEFFSRDFADTDMHTNFTFLKSLLLAERKSIVFNQETTHLLAEPFVKVCSSFLQQLIDHLSAHSNEECKVFVIYQKAADQETKTFSVNIDISIRFIASALEHVLQYPSDLNKLSQLMAIFKEIAIIRFQNASNQEDFLSQMKKMNETFLKALAKNRGETVSLRKQLEAMFIEKSSSC